jgi:hypothetical protein
MYTNILYTIIGAPKVLSGWPLHKAKFKNMCFVNMMILKDLSDLLLSQIETLFAIHWSVEKCKI